MARNFSHSLLTKDRSLFKKILFGFATLFAFLLSFVLASYFSGNALTLPRELEQAMVFLGSLFDVEPNDVSSIERTPNIVSHISSIRPEFVATPSFTTCTDTSKGKLQYKKVGAIYTWQDEQGIAHFSDQKPVSDSFNTLNFAGEKVFDYFSLNLTAGNLPYDFRQKLEVKLKAIFELYGHLLDKSSLKKIEINLNVFGSKTSYEQYKIASKVTVSADAPGFYVGDKNEAALLYSGDEQTMVIALHEATHAINRGIIGFMPRWLNEGMAKYAEQVQVAHAHASVQINDDFTQQGHISTPLLSLNTLFNATQADWDSNIRFRLYATAWAFVYYMMDEPHRKQLFAKLINVEQSKLCDEQNSDTVLKLLGLPLQNLQRQFTVWSKGRMSNHSI
jgi:hypothetical protein